MSYAPVELRHIRLKRRPFGYSRPEVTRVLVDVASSYEAVWRERADLADRVDDLAEEISRLRGQEHLLREALVSADRASGEIKERAKREAHAILEEARREAREITRRARAERETLALHARRIRLLLHSALDAIEESGEEGATGEMRKAGAEAA